MLELFWNVMPEGTCTAHLDLGIVTKATLRRAAPIVVGAITESRDYSDNVKRAAAALLAAMQDDNRRLESGWQATVTANSLEAERPAQ